MASPATPTKEGKGRRRPATSPTQDPSPPKKRNKESTPAATDSAAHNHDTSAGLSTLNHAPAQEMEEVTVYIPNPRPYLGRGGIWKTVSVPRGMRLPGQVDLLENARNPVLPRIARSALVPAGQVQPVQPGTARQPDDDDKENVMPPNRGPAPQTVENEKAPMNPGSQPLARNTGNVPQGPARQPLAPRPQGVAPNGVVPRPHRIAPQRVAPQRVASQVIHSVVAQARQGTAPAPQARQAMAPQALQGMAGQVHQGMAPQARQGMAVAGHMNLQAVQGMASHASHGAVPVARPVLQQSMAPQPPHGMAPQQMQAGHPWVALTPQGWTLIYPESVAPWPYQAAPVHGNHQMSNIQQTAHNRVHPNQMQQAGSAVAAQGSQGGIPGNQQIHPRPIAPGGHANQNANGQLPPSGATAQGHAAQTQLQAPPTQQPFAPAPGAQLNNALPQNPQHMNRQQLMNWLTTLRQQIQRVEADLQPHRWTMPLGFDQATQMYLLDMGRLLHRLVRERDNAQGTQERVTAAIDYVRSVAARPVQGIQPGSGTVQWYGSLFGRSPQELCLRWLAALGRAGTAPRVEHVVRALYGRQDLQVIVRPMNQAPAAAAAAMPTPPESDAEDGQSSRATSPEASTTGNASRSTTPESSASVEITSADAETQTSEQPVSTQRSYQHTPEEEQFTQTVSATHTPSPEEPFPASPSANTAQDTDDPNTHSNLTTKPASTDTSSTPNPGNATNVEPSQSPSHQPPHPFPGPVSNAAIADLRKLTDEDVRAVGALLLLSQDQAQADNAQDEDQAAQAPVTNQQARDEVMEAWVEWVRARTGGCDGEGEKEAE